MLFIAFIQKGDDAIITGAFMNDVMQIWTFIDPPPPSVTLNSHFAYTLIPIATKITTPAPFFRDVIFE